MPFEFSVEVDKYVKKLNTLNSEQKNIVTKLLKDNREVFSSKSGFTSIYEHVIRPVNDKIYVKKSYPVPLKLRNAVDEQISQMEELQIIERSDAQICNPLRIVKKQNGKVRVCLDAR